METFSTILFQRRNTSFQWQRKHPYSAVLAVQTRHDQWIDREKSRQVPEIRKNRKNRTGVSL